MTCVMEAVWRLGGMENSDDSVEQEKAPPAWIGAPAELCAQRQFGELPVLPVWDRLKSG